MDSEHNLVAEARQRLIYCVVHPLENHMVQAGAIRGVPDVHAGPLAYRFQALQNLDAVGLVAVRVGRLFFRFTHLHILIGITTYLNSASEGKLNSALEAASPNLHSTSLPATLFNTSSR